MCLLWFIFSFVVLCVVLPLILRNQLSSNDNRFHGTVPHVLSNTPFGEIPIPPLTLSFSNCLQRYDFANQQVSKNSSANDVVLHCGSFSKLQLANSRTPKFWSPSEIEINQRNKKLQYSLEILPLGANEPTAVELLSGSVFSLYSCLSTPVDGEIYFRLYRYEDLPYLSHRTPLESKLLVFPKNSSTCVNTSINVSHSNLVIPVLAKNSTAKPEFTIIDGYVLQFYYDAQLLGLLNDSYLIGDEPKTIPGNYTSGIVCYAAGASRTIFPWLVSVLVPVAWSAWLALPICFIIFIICLYCLLLSLLLRVVCKCCASAVAL